jgi:hypothetical protein
MQLDLRGVGDGEDGDGQGAYHLGEWARPGNRGQTGASSDHWHCVDKSGLVMRFSTLLESDNIRMLYSSTFHTANILVEARDVRRAKRLLQKKRSGEWATSWRLELRRWTKVLCGVKGISF